MSEILAEAGFLTVDASSVVAPADPEKSENSEQKLRKKLKELVMTYSGREEGQAKKIVSRMMTLGDPFRKAIDILGFEIDINTSSKVNPLLAFLLQKNVQDELLMPGFINISSFKALYKAVAKNLVAHSEFFARSTINDYNLIYCKRLYDLPADAIEEYLEEQSKVLKTSSKAYNKQVQLENRKIFLEIESIKELDIVKRAEQIKNTDTIPPTVQEAKKLNSLKLVKQIRYNDFDADNVSNKGVNKRLNNIISKLNDMYSKFAVLSILSNNKNKNEKVAKALKLAQFSNLNSEKLANAFLRLANEPIAQLSADEVDVLVDKIIESLKKETNAA